MIIQGIWDIETSKLDKLGLKFFIIIKVYLWLASIVYLNNLSWVINMQSKLKGHDENTPGLSVLSIVAVN
jgi:hypothetical protein